MSSAQYNQFVMEFDRNGNDWRQSSPVDVDARHDWSWMAACTAGGQFLRRSNGVDRCYVILDHVRPPGTRLQETSLWRKLPIPTRFCKFEYLTRPMSNKIFFFKQTSKFQGAAYCQS